MAIAIKDPRAEAMQRFLSLFRIYEGNLNGQRSSKMHDLRRLAADRMEELEFPGIKSEDWKYTSTSRLIAPQYEISAQNPPSTSQISSFSYKEVDAYQIVFVNGVLSEELSTLEGIMPGVKILSLEIAFADIQYETKCRVVLEKLLQGAEDAFLPMNIAFSSKGLFIHVDKQVKVDKPIHILHINSGENAGLSAPVQLFFTETGSELTVLESFQSANNGEGESGLIACLNYFNLAANSTLKYYKNQELGAKDFMVHQTFVDQNRDSVFTAFTADLGGRIVRNNMSAVHLEKNVLTNLYGVFLLNDEQHVDNQTFVDHAMPHCLSNELYKGILDGKSRGVFNGKVMVRPDAQKINAFQQNNILILSDNARMDSKPQLEIFADDVKCSHGATIGQMDETAVFYLRSRGLNESEARGLLQLAFVQEVTNFIDNEDIRLQMDERISTKFRK